MENSKILSASWLDILFDNRNKAYGAYELRKTYQQRVGKSLCATVLLAALIFTATSFSVSRSRSIKPPDINEGIMLMEVAEKTVKEPEPEIRKEEPALQTKPPRTEDFTTFTPVPDVQVINQPPSQDDLKNAKISDVKIDGPDFKNIATSVPLADGKGIAEVSKNKEPEGTQLVVDVQAAYSGNWVKFLMRNLDPEVPLQHDAPPGRYTIVIQFVVDKEGNVSDIKPLTHIGYGMEEEAVRVLKKATKWEPAIQNGLKVKAYRQQPITFEVVEQ